MRPSVSMDMWESEERFAVKPIVERSYQSRAPRNEPAKCLWMIPSFEICDGPCGYDPTGAVK
jgi:hypothetical protein